MAEKKKKWRIIFVVAALICICCLGVFGWMKYKDYKTQKQREATLKKIESSEFTGETEGEEPELPEGVKRGDSIDFDKLQGINDEIYAWIYIPDTKIDYPVAQSSTDNSYYLKYNFQNEPEFAGCIYTESLNKKDFSDPNTVVYGHNMKNGSMFQNLHKFESKDFFDEHDTVYIYTPKKRYVYKVFAAYTYDDRHLLRSIDFKDENVFASYLEQITGMRGMNVNIRSDQKVTKDDKIITLSTCVGGAPNNRYLVQAVLTQEVDVD